MTGQERTTFNQPQWKVRGDVYNTAGDLILTKTSTKDDLTNALLDLKAQLAALDGIPDEERRELKQEVEQAAADAQKPNPPKDQIAGRLERIKKRLSGLEGVASGALALGKTVAGIAGWVATFL